MMHIKRFLDWDNLKERLHSIMHKPPFVSEGEIWWASLGENIGAEINGKSNDFTRPVLIFRKLSNGFYFIIPLTTQNHTGTWYVNYKQGGLNITACLHQARSIDFRRLHRRLGELDQTDFKLVQYGFQNLYMKISPPSLLGGSRENPESS
ncbi:MAG: type II toxin-antitoxin system PemK/MazF family toxin [Candidatus Gracilibacteria bacterium]